MNPALSQAEFDKIWKRMGLPMGMYAMFHVLLKRFTEKKVRVVEIGNTQPSGGGAGDPYWVAGSIQFTSFDYDVLEESYLYVEVQDETPGAGQVTINFYKAAGLGAGDLVAHCAGNDAATGQTIAEDNSSGIAGTMSLGTVGVDSDQDEVRLLVLHDLPRMVPDIFDGGEDEDVGNIALRKQCEDLVQALATTIRGMQSTVRSFLNTVVKRYAVQKIGGNKSDAAGINWSLAVDSSSGAITPTFFGDLDQLRRAMIDNTTPQYFVKRVVSFTAEAWDSTNRGTGAFTSVTFYEHAPIGAYRGVCKDATIGAEQFEVTFTPTDEDGRANTKATIRARQRLTVKGSFCAPEIGWLAGTLARTWTKTGDTGTNNFAAATTMSATGETSSNTNGGIIYGIVTGAGPYTVSFYKATGGDSADLVAQDTSIAAGAAFVAEPQNSSGLTVLGTLGSAPSGAEITFNMKVFKADSSGDYQPDAFTVTNQLDSEGENQRIIKELFIGRMNQDAVAAATVTDELMQRGFIDPSLKEASS